MLSFIKAFIIHHEREVKIGIFVFLVAILSFGLGYLTHREFSRTPIIIEKCAETDL